MDILTEENYLITKAKSAPDPYTAKAWILAAKKLYPENFGVQFEAYHLEKNANNYEEAAKCFSYIIQTFQNQPPELWTEVSQITSALRIPEGGTSSEQEFYVKMFQHISYEVQHKILLLTANHSDNNLEHCKLILLLLKRFPQAIHTHSPRLLETLIQGIATNQPHFRDMLVLETLPMLLIKPPELPSAIVNRIMATAFEYYINAMFKDADADRAVLITDSWKNIFEAFDLCGRMLKWETFLPYNRDWSKDVYWQKLIQIVSSMPPRPSENKQILFCATILFVMSLQDYIQNVKHKIDDVDVEYILVEGFKENPIELKRRKPSDSMVEAPHISINPPCTSETPICLVTAAQCWQLLHSNEILQSDFSKLLRSIPLSSWINRFLIDLAIYLGRSDEAQNLLKDTKCTNIEKNLRLMSLAVGQPTFTIQAFDLLMKILSEMPLVTGQYVKNISANVTGRNLLLLPIAKRPILQYCTKLIVNALKQKLITEPNCTDSLLGNLLVMLQLDWPKEQHTAEQIFNIIRTKGHFIYLQFPNYIICPDMLEEFMSMLYTHGGDIHLEFVSPQPSLGTRRIGTRGADKGVKDDFKQIMKQQICKCNEDIGQLIQHFLMQEHMRLVQNIFEK